MFYNLRMNLSENKWTRGAIPALLLHCSIGTVYCWSIFSQEIASYIGFSKGAVEWAFSFAIFFLGMSAAVYFVMMFAGHLLLKKPAAWHEPTGAEHKTKTFDVIKTNPITFVGIWLMFYINITCGLALISQEKMIIKCVGLASYAGMLASITAIFNAGGRLGFSAWADKMKDRNTIYKLIFVLSIVFTALVIFTGGIANHGENKFLLTLVLLLLFVVNAGYGGGFSNVLTLLSDHYGMSNISAIHGITLSAWAIAGLTGNQMATWIVNHFGGQVEVHGVMVNPVGYQTVLYVTCVLYIIALCASVFLVRHKKESRA